MALEQFSRTVAAFLGVENASFRNWEAAFDAIAKAAKDERLQVLSELLEDSSAFPCAKKHYALFSKSGFTAAVVAAAGEKGIALVGLERLFAE